MGGREANRNFLREFKKTLFNEMLLTFEEGSPRGSIFLALPRGINAVRGEENESEVAVSKRRITN